MGNILACSGKQFSSLHGPNLESLPDSLKTKNLISGSVPHMAGHMLKLHLKSLQETWLKGPEKYD